MLDVPCELQLVLRIESTCLQALHTAAGLPASCDWTSHHTSRLKRPCEPHYLPLPALNGRGSCSSKLEEPCKPHCWLLMLAHLSSSLNNQPYFDSRSLPLVGFWWSPHHFPLPLSGVCARLPALCLLLTLKSRVHCCELGFYTSYQPATSLLLDMPFQPATSFLFDL